MAIEIIECQEFGAVPIRVEALLGAGELALDERVIDKGYFNVALRAGQMIFRADRYVGLIPVTSDLAIRVKPRASIASLSYMLAKSGVAPVAIPGFSRGYLPKFEIGEKLERAYAESLIQGVERVLRRGLIKGYVAARNPPKWRGRLLLSQTVQRHRARGVRYQHDFSYSTLSIDVVENVALKEALRILRLRLLRLNRRDPAITRIDSHLYNLLAIPTWRGNRQTLIAELAKKVTTLPAQLGYYRDPLWVAFLLLQDSLPGMDGEDTVAIDSLIVDASKIFEAYLRRVLHDRARSVGWNIKDGNLNPSNFFVESGEYTVRPDIVVCRGDTPIAVLDAKYKPQPTVADRYELLAFMDALGVKCGGLICPQDGEAKSSFLGTTAGEKAMSLLRFDLAASDPNLEADRLFANVKLLVDGDRHYR